MIKFSQIPYSTYSYDGMPKPTWVKATCPPNGIPHNFSLSDDDMLTYYLEIFRNRTAKDKPYIDQYSSIEDMVNVYTIGFLKILRKYIILLINKNFSIR